MKNMQSQFKTWQESQLEEINFICQHNEMLLIWVIVLYLVLND